MIMSQYQASKYVLTAPVVIGPRLMPALIIGQGSETYGTISAEIESFDEGPCAVIRYVIDTSGRTYQGTDLRLQPLYRDDTPGTIIRRALSTLCSFLMADAEAYAGSGRMGAATPPDGWLFDAQVAEWAYMNDTEISMVKLEIEEGE